MTRVAYIGSFHVPYCTEVHVARAFKENGCTVYEFPQDVTFHRGPETFLAQVRDLKADLVLYTRAHNASALNRPWNDAWNRLRDEGTATASIHLDRFYDLARQQLIYDRDPLFTMQHMFSTDGGNHERFLADGVNHHYMPPAVDRHEIEAMPGRQRPGWAYDVVFTGSGGHVYHREYPARGELLDHLASTYGPRFARFGHGGDHPVVRMQDLNDLYASAAIVIGDSCFANEKGSPRSSFFYSDRIPEVVGRGGFLLHPYVPGVREHYSGSELAVYAPHDWDDLDTQIGSFLANPDEREGYVERGRARVLREHTYTHRAAEILRVVGLEVSEPARQS